MLTDDSALMEELRRSGQLRLAEHLAALRGAAREQLARQLRSFDYELVRKLARQVRRGTTGGFTEPFEAAPVMRAQRTASELAAARRAGEDAVRRGEVAAFVVAGGQGSRLRFDGPKGCFAIGPVSGKTLFQILAEKVLAVRRRYGAAVPLYVMTSETNDAAVRAFFEAHRCFGLPAEDVFFCVQRMLPAFDGDGRLILDAPDHVFVNPDGHGGAYFALSSSGALNDMERRGIRHISYFQVDNLLVNAVDLLFIGEHIRTGSEMSSKVLAKREPLEKLGVFGYVDGELRVVEYSEMSEDLQRTLLPDGSLKYAFGSIAVHVIDAGFARRMAKADLPFHVAHKAIPYLSESGEVVTPKEPNGFKFERFIFDGIPHARNPLVMEVRREDEFAPVKNFSGADSPETARAAMVAQHRRWIERAGISLAAGAVVEISPLFALDADEVRDKRAELAGRVARSVPNRGLYVE